MRMYIFSTCVLMSVALFAAADPITVGTIDQKDPPRAKDLVEPASDEGIDKVGLKATVTAETGAHAKSKVYVLVNPLSNSANHDTWWVQAIPDVRDGKYSSSVQFGEGSQGAGEYFAIVVLATDQTFTVGQQLSGLPKANAYAKLKIVKRKP